MKQALSSAATIGIRSAHIRPADLNNADEPAKFHFDADKILISRVPLFREIWSEQKIAEKEVVDYSL